MSIGKTNACTVIENCFKRFCEIYPDHTFAEKDISFEVVDHDAFLPRLCDISRQHPIEGVDLTRHFANCDAATMRTPEKDYVVVCLKPEEAPVPFVIKVYHELAHIYCLDAQEPLDLQKTGDVIPGYLLWKEFVADYVALNALHHDFARFSYDDQAIKEQMFAGLQAMGIPSGPGNLSSLSNMANFIAFLLNLKDIDKHIGKLPIDRTEAGQRLRKYIKAVARTLYDKCQKASYLVIDCDFLHNLGFNAIEIQLFSPGRRNASLAPPPSKNSSLGKLKNIACHG